MRGQRLAFETTGAKTRQPLARGSTAEARTLAVARAHRRNAAGRASPRARSAARQRGTVRHERCTRHDHGNATRHPRTVRGSSAISGTCDRSISDTTPRRRCAVPCSSGSPGPIPAALALQFALTTSPPDEASWRRVSSLEFERFDPRSERTGDAFLHNPRSREAVGQPPLAGTRGRFIDTFQDENGDMAMGELRPAPFEVRGDFITLNVGGGFYPEGAYVELLIAGKRQFHATGCNSGIIGPRVWDTRAWVGEIAVLHIVDRLRRPFGHIVQATPQVGAQCHHVVACIAHLESGEKERRRERVQRPRSSVARATRDMPSANAAVRRLHE